MTPIEVFQSSSEKVSDGPGQADARVVDQDVDPAVRGEHLRHRRLDRGPRADVAGMPGPAQPAGGLGRGGAVEVQDRGGRALGGEPRGDGLPDAPRAAGDDGDPVSQLHPSTSVDPAPSIRQPAPAGAYQ